MEKVWRRLWGSTTALFFSQKRLPQDVRTSKVSRRDREGRARGFKDFQGLQREREGKRDRAARIIEDYLMHFKDFQER